MKELRSSFLKAVAFCYIGFPVPYLIVAAVFFQIPASGLALILARPLFYFISAIAMISGIGLWEAKRWGWYLFAIANVFIFYGNIHFLLDYGATPGKAAALAVVVLCQGVILYLITRELRVPYFIPRVRWWESSTYYKIEIPTYVWSESGERVKGYIMDLSPKGCFVKVTSGLPEGESVKLSFNVFGQEFSCRGRCVWTSRSSVTLPRGVGIRFDGVDRNLKRRLNITMKRLRKVFTLYRSAGPIGHDENLLQVLENLQKFPEEIGHENELDGSGAHSSPRSS